MKSLHKLLFPRLNRRLSLMDVLISEERQNSSIRDQNRAISFENMLEESHAKHLGNELQISEELVALQRAHLDLQDNFLSLQQKFDAIYETMIHNGYVVPEKENISENGESDN